MPKTKEPDIVDRELGRQLAGALKGVDNRDVAVGLLKDALDRVTASPTVRTAIVGVNAKKGVTEDMIDAFDASTDLLVRGPLVMNFDIGEHEEYTVAVFLDQSGRVRLSSSQDLEKLQPEEHEVLAEELFKRGVGPEDVVEGIRQQVRVRTNNIRQFASFLEYEHGKE